jgi:hypothetical protein
MDYLTNKPAKRIIICLEPRYWRTNLCVVIPAM